MNRWWLGVVAAVVSVTAASVRADATFYEHGGFRGRAFTAAEPVPEFGQFGFNDRISSIVVNGEPWEICEHSGFRGQCVVIQPGQYPDLRATGMNDRLSSARPAQREPVHHGEVTLFEHSGFHGRLFRANEEVPDLRQFGFNDRASSAMVLGEPWEACEDTQFGGRCVVLRPGQYPSLGAMGLNDRLSSIRPIGQAAQVDERRYAPAPQPVYDWRRRPGEDFFEARVISANAVFTTQQQRCWVEQRDRGPDPAGALIGGVIGGVIGHQIGSGSGRDAATVGGAVAGAVIGANIGSDKEPVQRCTGAPPQGNPDYWDVTYEFRGVTHRAQLTSRPGPTLTVNAQGEPRLAR